MGEPHPACRNHRSDSQAIQVSVPARRALSERYFDKKTIGLDFEGMKEDIKSADEGSIVSHVVSAKHRLILQILLHACAHNPTGIDPKQEQWKELSDVIKSKNHLVLFDMVNTSVKIQAKLSGIPRLRLGRHHPRCFCSAILCRARSPYLAVSIVCKEPWAVW